MTSLKHKLERKWMEQNEQSRGDKEWLKLRLDVFEEILREAQARGSNEDDTTQPEE